MRNLLIAAAGVALIASSGSAMAATMVVGGMGGECWAAAKAGRSDRGSIDLCTRALDQDLLNRHDRAGTFVNRAAMEVANHDWPAAHGDFQAALRIDPGMGEAHVGEGAVLISQERWPEAEAEVSRGLGLGSEEPEKGYYFRGIARWGQEDYKGAYQDLQRASALKPGWDLPRRQLAKFHVEPAPN